VVAFAVTDADGPAISADFYGFEPDFIESGEIATVVIRSSEPPAATEETMMAYHEFVAGVADVRACLPHRFGLVVDEQAVEAELARNHHEYVAALEATRHKSEWLLRTRAIPDAAATAAMMASGQRPPAGSPLETGEFVHRLVTAHLADEAATLSSTFESEGDDVFVRSHGDGLGFDLEIVAGSDQSEYPAVIDQRCQHVTKHLDVDLFGPTPCYRYSDRAMRTLA